MSGHRRVQSRTFMLLFSIKVTSIIMKFGWGLFVFEPILLRNLYIILFLFFVISLDFRISGNYVNQVNPNDN